MDCIYFDNAATSWPKPPGILEAISDFNEIIGANPGRSAHRRSIEAARIVYTAREKMASLVGVSDPLRIIFTKNATEAINLVILGLLNPGDHVITSGMEHNSVMRPLRYLESRGVELTVASCSGLGELDPDDVRRSIKKNTRAVIVTHASNITGTIMPIEDLALVAHNNGILFCVDAAQTAGNLPVNVEKTGIDLFCFTGHKSLLGPQGTGGLYIKKDLEKYIKPLIRGGTGSRSEFEDQPDFLPDCYESGTPNTIGLAGLAAGIEFVLSTGLEKIRKKEVHITGLFLKGLQDIKGVRLYGDPDPQKRTSVVSFTIDGISPSEAAFELDERFSILSRPGLQCAPAAHRTIGTFPEGTIRFSFGPFTTEDEISIGLKAVETLSMGI
ncbi:MAG: aminotransferase class V-fold PLP-dependent enzyme [Desulfobacterium sp.]|nr:aminotransferase class V-fold PLP-dependent enzyme [Desulfobacterium sp.]MBU3948134.1 aminotransferase class V-fold PLP-dependent enzyme [Pseudomonadota bacterium]MBU4010907.1 aminotransferase class V-fold PLP-dependent enzyme [Pseudomonadota bacterium]MBU4036661.1 aminotransferase class V-fold PLP-dependent enzyme [Pseudomonadota bacterium]